MGDSPPDESITSDSKASESQIGLNGRPDTLDVNLEIASEHGSERKSPFAEFEETRLVHRVRVFYHVLTMYYVETRIAALLSRI